MFLSLLFIDVQYNKGWLLENHRIQKTIPTIKGGVCIKKNPFLIFVKEEIWFSKHYKVYEVVTGWPPCVRKPASSVWELHSHT